MSDPAIAIGLDLGGTTIKGVRVDWSGRVLERARAASVPEAAAMVTRVRDVVAQLAGGRDDLPLGIAAAGVPHPDGRSVQFCPGGKLRLEGLVWREVLSWAAPVPVVNDANGALIGEAWVGAAAGKRHVLLLTLGTGVGGGVLVNGQLLRGARGRAGHVGHVSILGEGGPSILGTPGSLEDAIGEQTVTARSGGRAATTEALIAAVRAGDPEAAAVWLTSVRALARGLASLVNVLDPEIIVIGGGIARAGDALFGPLAHELALVEWRPDGRGVPIVAAQLGDLAGAIGAARLAMSEAAEA